jgi:glucosamine--fructose-6-phosphate aminotransferase (isomerizing)
MCGIFGVVTNQDIPIGKIALEGIKRLEYRGYDSVGIASLHDGKLYIKKDAGKIDDVHKKLKLDDFPGKIAIAHTRWATHGAPTKINSHPHSNCSNDIAVIHNGIIENFMTLKKELKLRGHLFKSDTDTEIIAHLIEEKIIDGLDLKDSIIEVLKLCKGSYGLVVLHQKFPNMIIAARKESPLVIGIEPGKTTYCASDIPAFLPLTKTCYILEDCEMAVLKAGTVEFFDLNTSEKIDKKSQQIEWTIDAAEKGGYDHFMLKEIYEEPIALRQTMKIPEEDLRNFAEILLSAENIYITGAGTSLFAALAGKFIISKFLGKYIQAIECSEFKGQLIDCLHDNSVIIAISQSGETIDTIEAIRWAKKNENIKILSITNVVGSSITRYSDYVIVTRAGPEIGVAATKTYSCQVITLALIALEISKLRKKETEEDIQKYYEALKSSPQIIENFLDKNIDLIRKTVKNLEKHSNYFFLARGISIGTAKEGGLKLKEVACRFIEGYSAASAKHGPIALVRKGFPIVFIAPPDGTYERLIGNVMEFKARGGKIISFVVEGDKRITELSDIIIRIPQPGNKFFNLFSPITFIPALQLLAYYTAIYHGLDPDKPLNLSKTVTVH